MKKYKIAIFASGGGSNALKIIERLDGFPLAEANLLITNKADAGAIEHAKNHNIPYRIFSRKEFLEHPEVILDSLREHEIDIIVLAGFLLKVPESIVTVYSDRIVNIHPALLPDFGGKGMYGDYVHQAVLDDKRPESGITIHLVNNHYDEGHILFQAKTPIKEGETVETLRGKIQKLEHKWYPEIIIFLVNELNKQAGEN